jgi:cell wall-associated NlpC family hydrolase
MLFAPLRRRAVLGAAGSAVAVLIPLTSVMTAGAASAAPAAPAAVSAPSAAAVAAPQAKAARQARAKAREHARAKRIIKVAARYKGRPYRYGATGPSAFDCSGYTGYVVRKAIGKHLPRTSSQQSRSGKVDRIKKSNRKVGDLVFFPRGGRVGHVAIYAGKHRIWHSPKPGSRVHKTRIYQGNVFYGRVV